MTHRMTISSFLALGLAMSPAIAYAGPDSGQNVRPPHYAGQSPGEAQEIFRKFDGVVTEVDTNKTTLTIKSENGLHAFKLTPKTKFTRNGKVPASAMDAVSGKTVDIVVVMKYGHPDEVVAVNIQSK